MAQECTDSSVATSSSPPPNWWDHHATTSLSSWTNANPACWHQPNPNSNSSCDEDVSISTSFTNASNHSGLTVESSRRLHADPAAHEDHAQLMGEAASDNQIWNHVLLSLGSNGELHNSQDVGENLLDVLSSKSISNAMFEPACDYLKQLENWEFTNSPSFNNMEKHLTGFSESLIETERLTKLSNLVSNWSIAPPDPEMNRHFEGQPCNISLNSSMDQYSPQDLCHVKQSTFSDSTNCRVNGTNRNNNSGMFPNYGIGSNNDHLKVENEHREMEDVTPAALLRRVSPFNANGIGYQIGLNNSIVGDSSKYYYGMQNSPRNFADVISFTSRLGKPLIDTIHAPKPSLKALNLSDTCKKQALQTNSPTRMNGGRGQGISEGKKKRISEDNSETVLKKPKQESSSTVSSTAKVPKVKLADRITALQQIVSPFGKTDTASVLYEAIGYIKFLQEQVQLLSNPYMKTNSQKDPWGGMDRKDKGDAKHDLRSRGLCLVPISCTPQVYRENTGSDYWTPAYRGCLYR